METNIYIKKFSGNKNIMYQRTIWTLSFSILLLKWKIENGRDKNFSIHIREKNYGRTIIYQCYILYMLFVE